MGSDVFLGDPTLTVADGRFASLLGTIDLCKSASFYQLADLYSFSCVNRLRKCCEKSQRSIIIIKSFSRFRMMRGAPIIVLSQGTKRESGHQVQTGNITAAKVVFLRLFFVYFLFISVFLF